jgi:hypothetical protein
MNKSIRFPLRGEASAEIHHRFEAHQGALDPVVIAAVHERE